MSLEIRFQSQFRFYTEGTEWRLTLTFTIFIKKAFRSKANIRRYQVNKIERRRGGSPCVQVWTGPCSHPPPVGKQQTEKQTGTTETHVRIHSIDVNIALFLCREMAASKLPKLVRNWPVSINVNSPLMYKFIAGLFLAACIFAVLTMSYEGFKCLRLTVSEQSGDRWNGYVRVMGTLPIHDFFC